MSNSNSKPDAASKSHSNSSSVASPTSQGHATAPLVMPPASLATAPPVPANAPNLEKGEYRELKHFNLQQIGLLPTLGAEVKGSTTWATDFGGLGLDQATMTSMVVGTAAIYTEDVNASAWMGYVQAIKALCTDSLLTQIELQEKILEVAVTKNPAIAQKYPTLAAFMSSRKAAAKKGLSTKKENSKKQAEEAPAPAAAPSAAAKS
jgi:hypothetical protein